MPRDHTRSDMVTRGAPPRYWLTPRRTPPKQAGPSKPRAPSAVLSSAGSARTRKGWRPRPRSRGRCGLAPACSQPRWWCPAGGREAWRWGQTRERRAGPRQYTRAPGAGASSGRWLGLSSVHTGAGGSSSGGLLMWPKGGRAQWPGSLAPGGASEGPVLWTSLLTL